MNRRKEIDEWTHYLHGPDNNAVANDTVVGPPQHYQWIGSPDYLRHHDHLSGLSAMVSARGRLFYIMDLGPRWSVQMPPQWTLVARDAFNGTILWQRAIENWHPHLWGLKHGPAQIMRRLVVFGDSPDEDKRVHCGYRISGKALSITQGATSAKGSSVSKKADLKANEITELTVTVDLAAQQVTLTGRGETVTCPLARRMDRIEWIGCAVQSVISEFSAIDITGG